MAVVNPFAGYRPDISVVDKVAALPYDVYKRAEAKAEVASHPQSFLRIDRPEANFGDDFDMYSDEAYEKASELLHAAYSDGTYVHDERSVYYIYELVMDGRSQTGIVACASIDDYKNNVIKKHENTRADKEVDRIKHIYNCQAQTGPIFLAYRDSEKINAVVDKVKSGEAVYDFTAEDGIIHRVWIIDQAEDIASIKEAFNGISDIYIADGHHRAASAVKVGFMKREENPDYTGEEEFNFFLSVLFPESQLAILPYNRVVSDLNSLSVEEFFSKLSQIASIEESAGQVSPSERGTVGMYLEGKWYSVTFNKELMVDDPVEGLDVSVLQNNILGPILGIDDPRTDKRIDFVGGIRGLGELERRCGLDMKLAFSMYPTTIEQLFDVADAGLLMPPKSTWFEPKLRSGIFIHRLDEE